jgi:L-lactate dehydrogenase complex protein LldE
VRIALFLTCLVDAVVPAAGKATVELLERLGHEVVFPPGQTCCGQMHINTGYQDEALPLVRHHVEVFEPYEVVVAPSGSCVGSVRHQHAMVARRAGDEALAERAEAVAAKTYELSELLVDVLGVEDVGAYYPHRVTYHPTCHSLRMLHVGDAPLRLLRAVRGIDLAQKLGARDFGQILLALGRHGVLRFPDQHLDLGALTIIRARAIGARNATSAAVCSQESLLPG